MKVFRCLAVAGLGFMLAAFLVTILANDGILGIYLGLFGFGLSMWAFGMMFFLWVVRLITRVVKDEWFK